jgi:hypothetical protein
MASALDITSHSPSHLPASERERAADNDGSATKRWEEARWEEMRRDEVGGDETRLGEMRGEIRGWDGTRREGAVDVREQHILIGAQPLRRAHLGLRGDGLLRGRQVRHALVTKVAKGTRE